MVFLALSFHPVYKKDTMSAQECSKNVQKSRRTLREAKDKKEFGCPSNWRFCLEQLVTHSLSQHCENEFIQMQQKPHNIGVARMITDNQLVIQQCCVFALQQLAPPAWSNLIFLSCKAMDSGRGTVYTQKLSQHVLYTFLLRSMVGKMQKPYFHVSFLLVWVQFEQLVLVLLVNHHAHFGQS